MGIFNNMELQENSVIIDDKLYRMLEPELGGHFAIMAEVVDTDSKWTNVVEGMTAYTPEQPKATSTKNKQLFA